MQIELKNISKSFGVKCVIPPTDLCFESRAFTTLLGPSGCGKTTLLRMIAGLETPDTGEILFSGRKIFSAAEGINTPSEKRGLGFVFQDFALWPHLTVFENVAFGLRARKNTQNLHARVMEALEAVQLEDFEKRYPHQLSGGQQQRVAFARAIVVKPECMLFDEPLSALDALLREEMRAELKEMTARLNVTSIFVTHDQVEAMSLSDRIAVICGGRVLQYASPEEIYAHPADPFVARFVGKSNWLNDGAMIRPENLHLAQQAENGARPMTVSALSYTGDGYDVLLKDNSCCWHYYTRKQIPVGTEILIGIDREHIVRFDDLEGEKVS